MCKISPLYDLQLPSYHPKKRFVYNRVARNIPVTNIPVIRCAPVNFVLNISAGEVSTHNVFWWDRNSRKTKEMSKWRHKKVVKEKESPRQRGKHVLITLSMTKEKYDMQKCCPWPDQYGSKWGKTQLHAFYIPDSSVTHFPMLKMILRYEKKPNKVWH